MKWCFIPQLPGQVETEVTQRDQFKNDDVDLSDTIVREAVQNSLDAALDESTQVTVSFRWINGSDGPRSDFVKDLFEGHLEHARASEIEVSGIDFGAPNALVIEDFGTRGLTGSVSSKDDDNFSDFWRRHGKSHKTGKSRGRWGLGKLVYSTASELSAFFGATVRAGDPKVHVMGQTVLTLREVDGVEYPPHAFFADMEGGDDLLKKIQVPIKDLDLVAELSRQFKLERCNKSGLSVVIPFPTADLKPERMIGVAIENYFYPVIAEQLVLRFDDIEVNASNIRELAHKYASDRFHDIDTLFDFIFQISDLSESDHYLMNETWAADHLLDENDFAEDDIEMIRSMFANGKLVALKLPITLKKKNGQRVATSFSVYVQRPEQISKGVDLYVRGGLTLPQEAKFGERRALGAMIAEDEVICSFLGDAENAAHTRWIANAEKVRSHYQAPGPKVKLIKNVVLNLYDMLAEVTEEKDELALSSFFWTTEPDGVARRKRQAKSPVEIPPLPAPKPKLFFIHQTQGGFTVGTTKHATTDDLPENIKIVAAYDVAAGNPFNKYSPLDFKLGSKEMSLAMSKSTAKLTVCRENTIEATVTGVPFKINVTGFDPNRDLKVKIITGT